MWVSWPDRARAPMCSAVSSSLALTSWAILAGTARLLSSACCSRASARNLLLHLRTKCCAGHPVGTRLQLAGAATGGPRPTSISSAGPRSRVPTTAGDSCSDAAPACRALSLQPCSLCGLRASGSRAACPEPGSAAHHVVHCRVQQCRAQLAWVALPAARLPAASRAARAQQQALACRSRRQRTAGGNAGAARSLRLTSAADKLQGPLGAWLGARAEAPGVPGCLEGRAPRPGAVVQLQLLAGHRAGPLNVRGIGAALAELLGRAQALQRPAQPHACLR